MIQNLPNLTWLRTFETVSRCGSFTAAGAELGLTQAAVSTHVRLLESHLGCTLFRRTTRRLALTDMGEAYLPSVRKALEELALSTLGLFGAAGSGVLTVRAPISTAVLLLAPRISEFCMQHPGIDVRFVSAIWASSVVDADVDVDIRLGHDHWPGLRAELLCEDTAVAICSPSAAGRLADPEDLLTEPLIHILGFEDHWARYFAAQGVEKPVPAPMISVDTSLAAVEMVAAGAGIALVVKRGIRHLVEEGRVIQACAGEIPLGLTHYLVGPLDARRTRKETEYFKTWLRDLFA